MAGVSGGPTAVPAGETGAKRWAMRRGRFAAAAPPATPAHVAL